MKNKTLINIYETIQDIRVDHDGRHGSREQEWIENHLTDVNLKQIVLKLSVIALHILSLLEKHPQAGVELATTLKVTRGGVTRAAKKLIDFDLVSAFKRANDKKQIFYQLTASGQKIAEVHDAMHQEIEKKLETEILTKYSEEELQTIAKFLNDLHNFEDQLEEY